MAKSKKAMDVDGKVKPFKMPHGRPRLYSCAEMLENHINEYLDICIENEKPITMVGFANFAGMDKSTLTNWGSDKTHSFFAPTKRLKQFAEEYATGVVFEGKNCIGGMFILKTNHGYVETSKTITEHKMFDPLEQAGESVENLIKKINNSKQNLIETTSREIKEITIGNDNKDLKG